VNIDILVPRLHTESNCIGRVNIDFSKYRHAKFLRDHVACKRTTLLFTALDTFNFAKFW